MKILRLFTFAWMLSSFVTTAFGFEVELAHRVKSPAKNITAKAKFSANGEVVEHFVLESHGSALIGKIKLFDTVSGKVLFAKDYQRAVTTFLDKDVGLIVVFIHQARSNQKIANIEIYRTSDSELVFDKRVRVDSAFYDSTSRKIFLNDSRLREYSTIDILSFEESEATIYDSDEKVLFGKNIGLKIKPSSRSRYIDIHNMNSGVRIGSFYLRNFSIFKPYDLLTFEGRYVAIVKKGTMILRALIDTTANKILLEGSEDNHVVGKPVDSKSLFVVNNKNLTSLKLNTDSGKLEASEPLPEPILDIAVDKDKLRFSTLSSVGSFNFGKEPAELSLKDFNCPDKTPPTLAPSAKFVLCASLDETSWWKITD